MRLTRTMLLVAAFIEASSAANARPSIRETFSHVLVELRITLPASDEELEAGQSAFELDQTTKTKTCSGMGLLVGPRLIVTAGHILTCDEPNAPKLAKDSYQSCTLSVVTDARHGNPKEFHESTEDAKCWVAGNALGLDLGLVELKETWPGWSDEYRVPFVRFKDEGFPNSPHLFYWAYQENSKADDQTDRQGLHSLGVSLTSFRFMYRDQPRIWTRPGLRRGYSGSPLVLSPCGLEDWCVIGILSSLVGDASAGISFSEPSAMGFLTSNAQTPLDEYRARFDGVRFAALLPMVEYHVGRPLNGFALGAALRLGGETGITTTSDVAIGISASAGLLFFLDGRFQTWLYAPASGGDFAIPGVAARAQRAFFFDAALSYVPNRRTRLPLVAEFGPIAYRISIDGDSGRGSPDHLASYGARSRLAIRKPISRDYTFEFGVSWIVLKHHFREYGYTFVPGQFESRNAAGSGTAFGIDILASRW